MDKDFINALKNTLVLIEQEKYKEASEEISGGFMWSEFQEEEKIIGISWYLFAVMLLGKNDDSSN